MPGSGNKGDRGDGTSGGFGGGGYGGGGLGGGGVGRDTISAYGGKWARMGNFRGDPGLGGGGAVGFSGINSLAQALAAERQNPSLAQRSGLSDAIAGGRFGTPTGLARAARQSTEAPSLANPYAKPPTQYAPPPTQYSPPARPPLGWMNPAPPAPPPGFDPVPPVGWSERFPAVTRVTKNPNIGPINQRDLQRNWGDQLGHTPMGGWGFGDNIGGYGWAGVGFGDTFGPGEKGDGPGYGGRRNGRGN